MIYKFNFEYLSNLFFRMILLIKRDVQKEIFKSKKGDYRFHRFYKLLFLFDKITMN